MSTDELGQLKNDLNSIKAVAEMATPLMKLMRLLVGILVASSVAIASVAFWVKATTDSLARTEDGLIRLEQKREATLADWQVWRAAKDANDIKLTVIVENQQRILEAMATQKPGRLNN